MNERDRTLLAAYRAQNEEALQLTRDAYGRYIRKTAFSILHSEEDAKEVENEVLLKLWQHPETDEVTDLKSYIGQLSRRAAIDKLRQTGAKRRGGSEYGLALEELEECLPAENDDPLEALAIRQALDGFLRSLPRKHRQLFLCRYWYAMSVRECSDAFGMSEGAVKTALHRLREQLRTVLEREDIEF